MKAREKHYCKFVGAAIRALREARSKSVRLFAYENDIPQATLSRIERGDNEAQLVTLKKSRKVSTGHFHNYFDILKNKFPMILKFLMMSIIN